MDKQVNTGMVQRFADEYCILMNYVRCNDFSYDSPQMRDKYPEWEGQYGSNAGVVAFVINGNYYATPFVEEALDVLERANMKHTGIHVPFGGFFEFPYKLGPEEIRKIWLSGYNPK